MALTAIQVQKAKLKEKPYKLSDERGLYLLVNPNGSKLWKFKYRFNGVERKLSIGKYPEISLAAARDKREEARTNLANDIDPSALKASMKRAKKLAGENSFEKLAREWHTKNQSKWTPKHAERILLRLEQNIFPWLGKKPITEISAPDLLIQIQRIEERGAHETAHRTLQICGQIFRYAIVSSKAINDITKDLRDALAPVSKRNHPSITKPAEVGKLLRAIYDYEGFFVTKCALKLAPLFFVRPGELRQAEWKEFHFDLNEWHIPEHKMKMRQKHIVPLSKQALKILKELQAVTGDDQYLFPGIRSKKRPMSENTVNGALRRLGYTKDEMTGHGFRSMASTLLNERGWNPDAIERQLAHSEGNSVRAAYNYAEYLTERCKMMQDWADYLDDLRLGAKVITLKVG